MHDRYFGCERVYYYRYGDGRDVACYVSTFPYPTSLHSQQVHRHDLDPPMRSSSIYCKLHYRRRRIPIGFPIDKLPVARFPIFSLPSGNLFTYDLPSLEKPGRVNPHARGAWMCARGEITGTTKNRLAVRHPLVARQ